MCSVGRIRMIQEMTVAMVGGFENVDCHFLCSSFCRGWVLIGHGSTLICHSRWGPSDEMDSEGKGDVPLIFAGEDGWRWWSRHGCHRGRRGSRYHCHCFHGDGDAGSVQLRQDLNRDIATMLSIGLDLPIRSSPAMGSPATMGKMMESPSIAVIINEEDDGISITPSSPCFWLA
ncbi:hypothetical protein ACLOJK_004050 [Asimina triloba]